MSTKRIAKQGNNDGEQISELRYPHLITHLKVPELSQNLFTEVSNFF